MKKVITRIILTVLTVVVILSTFLLYEGHEIAKDVINQEPIEEVVSRYTSKDNYVIYEDIDDDFVNAVVAVEDKRFFVREGFDYIALARAIINNVMNGKLIEGGSTISQQIAKNLYFNTYNRGLEEKIAEVFIMLELENNYSKEELFALYANMNYYGDGYWGIEEAAQGYYKTEASDLTIAEAAMLAGIPNAPSIYQLSTGYDLAKKRQEKVLSRMLEENYISQDEYEIALKEDVRSK